MQSILLLVIINSFAYAAWSLAVGSCSSCSSTWSMLSAPCTNCSSSFRSSSCGAIAVPSVRFSAMRSRRRRSVSVVNNAAEETINNGQLWETTPTNPQIYGAPPPTLCRQIRICGLRSTYSPLRTSYYLAGPAHWLSPSSPVAKSLPCRGHWQPFGAITGMYPLILPGWYRPSSCYCPTRCHHPRMPCSLSLHPPWRLAPSTICCCSLPGPARARSGPNKTCGPSALGTCPAATSSRLSTCSSSPSWPRSLACSASPCCSSAARASSAASSATAPMPGACSKCWGSNRLLRPSARRRNARAPVPAASLW